MKRTDALYQSFVEILREELVPAMGCTEPIAIAYAAAQARAVLGKRPERVRIEVSGNIIKNVKSVVVPHTGSMHGIAAQTLMLAARGMGYDSCPMDGFDFDAVAKLIQLPANHVIGLMVAVGKRNVEHKPRVGRLPLSQTILRNHF